MNLCRPELHFNLSSRDINSPPESFLHMLANQIAIFRVILLFGVVGLLYWEGLWPKVLAFVAVYFVIWMDALDGQIARRAL